MKISRYLLMLSFFWSVHMSARRKIFFFFSMYLQNINNMSKISCIRWCQQNIGKKVNKYRDISYITKIILVTLFWNLDKKIKVFFHKTDFLTGVSKNKTQVSFSCLFTIDNNNDELIYRYSLQNVDQVLEVLVFQPLKFWNY